MHSGLSKFTNSSQFSNVSKKFATAVSQCRGPLPTCFNRFYPWIMDRCFLSRNTATHTFFHLLNALKSGCPILLANCFKENSVCFRPIGGLPSALPKSDELSLSSAASYSSYDISGNGGKSAIPATSVFSGSAGSWNLLVRRLIWCLPGALKGG